MSDLIIRQFREEHHAGVVKLWQETLGDQQSWNEPSYIIERKVAQNDGLSFVSESVGEIVATVLAGYDGIRGWIY